MTENYKATLVLAEQMLQVKAASTKDRYMQTLELFDDFPTRASIVAITNQWLEGGLTGSSIRVKHAAIRWLLNHFPRCFDPYDAQEAINYMKEIKTNKPKMSVATPEQVEKILDNADSRDSLIIALLYYHGMRVSDVTNLKLSNFRESDGKLLLEFMDEKTEKPHVYRVIDKVIPLYNRYVSGQRKDILLSWTADKTDGEYLFIGRTGHLAQRSIQRRVSDICGSCGFPHLHCHSFRHGCATAYAKAGATAETIQYALGHKSIASSARYMHLDENDLYEVSKGVF